MELQRKSDKKTVEKVKSALLCIQRFQWEQGCTAQAILEYEGLTEEVFQLCEAAVLRAARDGRLGVMEKNESVDDPAAIGESLLCAAKKTGREDWKKAADRMYYYLKNRAPKTTDGILYHFNIKNQVWVDANYMAPPFLCKYGDVEEAMKQIKGFRRYLYDEKQCLMSHIWDDDLQEFERKDFWGVGNGWTLAGLTRVAAMLKDGYEEERLYVIGYLKELLDGCLRYQMEDGRFHDVLNDPQSFVETNIGQMAAYSIYRGVKEGYLDESYLDYADRSREAAYHQVDELGFVRGVCGMPDFLSSGVASEGQAFFILMEAAARDYYEGNELK